MAIAPQWLKSAGRFRIKVFRCPLFVQELGLDLGVKKGIEVGQEELYRLKEVTIEYSFSTRVVGFGDSGYV